ncbi:MAG: hypothetical protein ACQESR_19065 [Planctomycetota bacterium]
MESCSTQAVLPLVGLAAHKGLRDRYNHLHPLTKSSARFQNASGWREIRVLVPWSFTTGQKT